MTKTESTIRFLFGASRKDIRPLVHAVDITIKLMFSQGIPMDDIRVTHAVYPQVAKRLKTRSGASPSAKTTARRIQRLANACWDALVERNLVKEFLGTSLRDLQAPRDLLFYSAQQTERRDSHGKTQPSPAPCKASTPRQLHGVSMVAETGWLCCLITNCKEEAPCEIHQRKVSSP